MRPLFLLASIALPSFLVAKLLSLALPAIGSFLANWLGSAVKRAAGWELTLPPWVGGGLHYVAAFGITALAMQFHVQIVPADLACLADPNSHTTFNCLSGDSINAIAIFLTSLVSSHIGASTLKEQRDYAEFRGRYAGRPRGR